MRRLKHPDPAELFDRAAAATKSTKEAKLAKKARIEKLNPRLIVDKASEEAAEMRRTGDWSAATGLHIVSLYAWLHSEIYKVEAGDLLQKEAIMVAINQADRILATEFGGDAKRMVGFVAWAWARERKNLSSGRDTDFRITWRYQFCSKHLLTNYRVDVVRGVVR